MAYTRFHLLLRERITEEISKVSADLAHNASMDHKLIVGQVLGMETCLKLCDQIEGEFDERSDSASSG
jgi:hypothetical protein